MHDPDEEQQGGPEKKKTKTTRNLRKIEERELMIPNGGDNFLPGENCLMYLDQVAGDETIEMDLSSGLSGIIPQDFARMVPNLETLTIGENIRGQIGFLEKLKNLTVSDGIEFVGPMNELKRLEISCNQPFDVSQLDEVAPNITALECTQSGITGNLPSLTMLTFLTINGTELTYLPFLPRLQYISLYNTKITRFELTDELTNIILENNADFSMTADQFSADQMRMLTVVNQPFNGVLPSHPVLEFLHISKTTISGIGNCPNLGFLDFFDNQSLTGGVEFLKQLNKQTLGVFNEEITQISIHRCPAFFDHETFVEIDFSRFRGLQTLHLTKNQIISPFPRSIAQNTSVIRLDLTGNRFLNNPEFFDILGRNMFSFGGRKVFVIKIDLNVDGIPDGIPEELLKAAFVAITRKIEQQRIHPTYNPRLSLPQAFWDEFDQLPPNIARGTLDDKIIHLHQLLVASEPHVMGGLRRTTRRQKRKNKKTKKKRKRLKKYSRY